MEVDPFGACIQRGQRIRRNRRVLVAASATRSSTLLPRAWVASLASIAVRKRGIDERPVLGRAPVGGVVTKD
jgi:hypothetical protein